MKKLLFTLALMFAASHIFAHTINYSVESASTGNVFIQYLTLGFKHILPLGVDHILFILCIFFLNSKMRSVIVQASMFTLAHTITLMLTASGVINPPGSIVEVIIALSIAFLAIENIYNNKVSRFRLITIFVFGLVHGMGFAGALAETGIPADAVVPSIIAFNIGVELGQLAIIFIAYILVSYNFSQKVWYRKRIIIPVSILVFAISMWWTIERVMILNF